MSIEWKPSDIDQLLWRVDELAGLVSDPATRENVPADVLASIEGKSVEMSELVTRIRGDLVHKQPGTAMVDEMAERFMNALADNGVTSGRLLEIAGAWALNFESRMPDFDFDYVEIFPKDDAKNVILNDAISLTSIPDEAYDGVASISVLEHINKPWLAAEEIIRVLKPGGIVYHFVPFSFPYHGSPADYYRYTPAAMEELFEGFEVLHSDFSVPFRREGPQGTATMSSEDEHPAFANDSFGGWRECWFSAYLGRKPLNYTEVLRRKRREQLALDGLFAVYDAGFADEDAYAKTEKLLADIVLDRHGRLRPREGDDADFFGPPPTRQQIIAAWKRYDRNERKTSHLRYVLRSHFPNVPALAGHPKAYVPSLFAGTAAARSEAAEPSPPPPGAVGMVKRILGS